MPLRYRIVPPEVTNRAFEVTNLAFEVTNLAFEVTNRALEVTNRAPGVTYLALKSRQESLPHIFPGFWARFWAR